MFLHVRFFAVLEHVAGKTHDARVVRIPHCWPEPASACFATCFAAGVDGVFADFPDIALRVRGTRA
jgi:glycerophosphoryl diester phosphodiesterase